MLTWEFKRLPILHNGPLNTKEDPAISDDSDLTTTLSNGYLQNVCQRYVLGVEGKTNFENEGAISEKYMHYRPFENKERPTLREANDRVMYLATNLQKTDCGNFIYGKITCESLFLFLFSLCYSSVCFHLTIFIPCRCH